MAFYAKPSALLSPGDVFPELPLGTVSHPLKIVRKSDYNPPPSRGPADLRKVFAFPQDAEAIGKVEIMSQGGEAVLASARVSKAMLLSWGSQIEEDLRNLEKSGRT